MSLISTVRFITSHPLCKKRKREAIQRFLKWQVACRFHPFPVIYPFLGQTKLVMEKGLTGATGNLYTGLHEFSDMAFLLHFLVKGDLFLDIGANIGSYTVLASGYRQARTIAFEPASDTFQHLQRNLAINNLHQHVRALNMALGSRNEKVAFTAGLDTVNHVATSDEKADVQQVKMKTLDSVLGEEEPVLLKIDVEGFETEVLNGARQTLAKQSLIALIIELNGSGWRYGYNENLVHDCLVQHNFKPFRYHPFTRELEQLEKQGKGNTIYLRDLDQVVKRINKSSKVFILNQSF